MKSIFVLLLITLSFSKVLNGRNDLFTDTEIDQAKQTYWFDQLLDHSNSQQSTTFKQRYHVYDNSVKGTPKMVVLYICGEWTCDGIGTGQLPFIVAERYQGLILVLEHRYYGQSQPFPDWSTENLKLLNIHQALDDIAYFIQQIKVSGLYGITPDTPFIHMGGSYPGALAAWFRYKYPHLTVGGLASSAVVQAITDYYKYDYQVFVSASESGIECVNAIQTVNKYIEEQLVTNRDAILATFKAQDLTDIEFLSMIADIYAGMVQGKQRSVMCNNLIGKTAQQQFDAVVKMAASTVDQESYGSEFLKKIEIDFNSASRQWTYQTCTEVGYFQTANPNQSQATRSQQLKIGFFKDLCKYSYGVDIFPDQEQTNNYYGGVNIKVDNLIFSNGSDDPWQHASIIKDDGRGLVINYIKCTDCSHCIDFKAPTANDPKELIAGRKLILDTFDKWLGYA